MNKNLIKIEGVYNNLKDAQEHNIFCTMLVDFSDFNNILINIKNCEITDIDEFNKKSDGSFLIKFLPLSEEELDDINFKNSVLLTEK